MWTETRNKNSFSFEENLLENCVRIENTSPTTTPQKKENRGGVRKGAGRKKGTAKPHTVISFYATLEFMQMLDSKRGNMSRPAFLKSLVEKA